MMSKISMFFGIIILLCVLIFGFVFFEPIFTEEVIDIKVTNKEVWSGEKKKYFIFSEKEVFLNEDNYYHNNKSNADEIYRLFQAGNTYRVKVVGLYIPFLPRFRNILTIMEKKDINVPLPQDY
ncbi:MAG: hypothetical protein HND39_07655 [Ignavibacteriota bacterium]|nr:hypothetical protein [Ignavibacteriales bacterium]MCC7093604.1 hypothetical protein [Ignavibacteriaceae bacterium]MEB2297173.1 hypothetical protein [Ignavibacteria bacterium]QKJ96169.1 MAG: hypothetical protein HND39_07655 [Ignavibacteriota bacterium]NUM61386.1 hypothetical protein [Ignavibacteriaceae bacterium]